MKKILLCSVFGLMLNLTADQNQVQPIQKVPKASTPAALVPPAKLFSPAVLVIPGNCSAPFIQIVDSSMSKFASLPTTTNNPCVVQFTGI